MACANEINFHWKEQEFKSKTTTKMCKGTNGTKYIKYEKNNVNVYM